MMDITNAQKLLNESFTNRICDLIERTDNIETVLVAILCSLDDATLDKVVGNISDTAFFDELKERFDHDDECDGNCDCCEHFKEDEDEDENDEDESLVQDEAGEKFGELVKKLKDESVIVDKTYYNYLHDGVTENQRLWREIEEQEDVISDLKREIKYLEEVRDCLFDEINRLQKLIQK